MALAFLRAAAAMVAFLEDNTVLAFRAYPYQPDYRATLEGATFPAGFSNSAAAA
jgi:hypothetical protein